MSNSGAARRSKWTALCIAMLVGSSLYLTFIQSAVVRDATLSQHGGPTRAVTLPASFRPGDYRVSFTLYSLPLASRSFTLHVDDCALNMTVGGKKLPNSPIPFCDFTRGRTILIEGLTYGANKIEVDVRNTAGAGSFSFTPTISLWNRLAVQCLLILSLFIAVSYGLTVSSRTPRTVRTSCMLVMTFVSLELLSRVFFSTPDMTAKLLDGGNTSARIRWLLKNASNPSLSYSIDEHDSNRGWRLRENLNGTPPFPSDVTSTPDGRRTIPMPETNPGASTYDIMMFGDSFTFGEEVSDHETYPSILARNAPEFRVMNFGVHGYGHDQMLIYLKEVIGAYKPHFVTLGFVRWDIERNTRTFRDYAKPRFVLTTSSPPALRLTNVPVPSPEELSRYSFTASRFGFLLSLAVERLERAIYPTANEAEAKQLTVELLTEFASVSRQHGAIPLFAYLPDESELRQPHLSQLKLFNAICQRASAICVDTTPHFSSIKDHASLFRRGGHYSKAGNELVATSIMRTLRSDPRCRRAATVESALQKTEAP
jgi:hypothetical protein